MRKKRIKTNEDLVRDLMNYSPYGALCQPFIMQAIREYAQEVVDEEENLLKKEKEDESNGRISIISTGAWVGIAKDITERMDEFYKR